MKSETVKYMSVFLTTDKQSKTAQRFQESLAIVDKFWRKRKKREHLLRSGDLIHQALQLVLLRLILSTRGDRGANRGTRSGSA